MAKVEQSIADSVLLYLVEQGAVADLESLGGVRAITARSSERPANQVYFESSSSALETQIRPGFTPR